MASNHTSNYGLCQWEATDAVLRTDFNEDNTKIDAALKSQAGSISSLSAQMVNKANTGTVSSLSTTVSQKADRSDLEAETSARVQADNAEKAAREAADAANMATLRSENCWVKLAEVTLETDQDQISLDLSGISMDQFRVLEMQGEFSFDQAVSAGLQFNQSTSSSFHGPGGKSVSYATFFYNEMQFSCFTRIQKSLYRTSGLFLYSLGASYGYSGSPAGITTYGSAPNFEDIRSIQIIGINYEGTSVPIKAGTSVTLYGLKR